MIQKTLSLYKTSFTGLTPQTWLLSTVMLINRSGTMVIPFMTLYLTSKEMGRSLSDAGIVISLFGIGSIIGAFLGGKLSDKIGFHKVQLITLLSGGIMFLVLGQIKSFPLICICTFLLSLVNEAFRPANSSAVAYYSSVANRTRSFSLNRLAINLGWAVGTSVGGLIASYNYELLFWVDGGTNIAAAILLFFSLNPKNVVKKAEIKPAEIIGAASPYKDKAYLLFIFLTILFGFCFFQMFSTVPKYFRDNLFLSETYIGFVMALNGLLIVVIEMVLVYRLEGKKKPLVFSTIGTFICAIAFLSLLLPMEAKPLVLIMIILITIGEIISMPFMNTYWTMRTSDQNRGAYAAMYTMAWGIGQSTGPYVCSRLVELSNFNVMFIFLGGVMMFAAFGFWRLNKI
jgi:predicted MFS family arabinose efflux permease